MTQTIKKLSIERLPLKPSGHYVLVKPDPVIKKTESGIITGTKDLHKREEVARVEGTLVAVGPQAWVAFGGEPWAEVGDRVYIKRHVSDIYEDEADYVDDKPQKYFLMADENILAVIEE